MKVGDIVRQCNKIVKMQKGRKNIKPSKMTGVVIGIRDMSSPRNSETQKLRDLLKMIGRPVDVLWSNGKVSENFAENSLEIIHES